MGENPSIYTHNRSRESYSIPRKYLSIGVCHGCVAHDRHAPMSHIRHGIGNRHILTLTTTGDVESLSCMISLSPETSALSQSVSNSPNTIGTFRGFSVPE